MNSNIARRFVAIAKGRRNFQHGGNLQSDRFEFDEILDFFALVCVEILANAIASHSASISLDIRSTNSRRCNSRAISALSRGGDARPSPVRN